jgi:hypothetical protein
MEKVMPALLCASAMFCLLFLPASTYAQGQADWEAVSGLKPGTRLWVQPGRIEGTLQSVDINRLTLLVGKHMIDLARTDVARIERRTNAAKRKTLYGFVIGTVLGTAMWRGVGRSAPLIGAGVGGLGALFGATDGAFDYSYEVIYQLPVSGVTSTSAP